MVRRLIASVLVVCLLLTVTAGIVPTFAEQGGGGAPELGDYRQLGATYDLASEHVSWQDGNMKVEGPVFTNELTVNLTFVEAELGPWGSTKAFVASGSNAIFTGRQATFVPLDLGPGDIFTWGHESQFRFMERPMWVNVSQEAWGLPMALGLADGTSTGQRIFLAKEWLSGRGIHQPNVTHEDGTVLPVNRTEDHTGYFVDVPHFSYIVIRPGDLDVKGRQGSLVFPHVGERRFDYLMHRIEVDVGHQLATYELLVELEGVSRFLLDPVVSGHDWTVEDIKGVDYIAVSLAPEGTPTTVLFRERPWAERTVLLNGTQLVESALSGSSWTLPIPSGPDLVLNLTYVGESEVLALPDGLGGWQNITAAVLHLAADASANLIAARFLVFGSGGVWGWVCSLLDHQEQNSEVIVVARRANAGGSESDALLSQRSLPYFCEDVDLGSYPYSPPPISVQRTLNPQFHLDDAYVDEWGGSDQFSVAAQYVWTASDRANSMWETYTGNKIGGSSAGNIHNVWKDGEGQIITQCSIMLQRFGNYINSLPRSPNEYYNLITGHDGMDCNGAGNIGDQPGQLAEPPTTINLGLDRGAYRGFSNFDHLGKLLAQEVGHAFGEPSHTCAQVATGEYSIMANSACGAPWDLRNYWLHYTHPEMPPNTSDSRQRIIDGTTSGYG